MDLCIIIPTYNAKDTIKFTLESIKNQKIDYKFEVVIVNDCSRYEYTNFIKEYIQYFNIREIKTPMNGGPGFSRQFGIINSKSKYITFIDSDDTFYNQYAINSMIKKMDEDKSDILISKFIYNRDNISIVKNGDIAWLHGKMYRRYYLTKNNIKFNNSRANEDNGFNWLCILLSPKISFLNMTTYSYNENITSITRKDARLYRFNGIEGFCYNMNWACEEAISRNVTHKKIKDFILDVMITLYFFYVDLKDNYDVKKMFIWGNKLFFKFEKYCGDYSENELLQKIKIKKEAWFLENRIINLNIDFKDFLNMWKK